MVDYFGFRYRTSSVAAGHAPLGESHGGFQSFGSLVARAPLSGFGHIEMAARWAAALVETLIYL